MSLALSLATVLIGILCTQWLREYERDPPLDPKEAIALRQLRYEGLIAWRVPKILSVLPVLLHWSLVLFFAGLIDLLWSQNLTVAIFVSFISGVLLFFVVATTVLPTIQMLLVKDIRLRTPQCPYKSAQSWTVHRIVTFFVQLFPVKTGLGKVPFSFFARYKPFFNDKDWVDFDLHWRDARARPLYPKVSQASSRKVHKDHAESDVVQGLVWLDKNLGQNIEMIHTIHHCLRDLPPDQAIPTLIQLDDSVKSHLISTKDDTIAYPAHNTAEHERRDVLSALFLELNSRAFTQLDQYQLEAIIRNINSRLEWRARHPLSTQDTNIVDCLPFVRWPLHAPRGLPGGNYIFYVYVKLPLTQMVDLVTQFLLCMKGLVCQGQTNAETDGRIWDLVRQVLSCPSLEESNSQHDLHAKLAFDIMLAYERGLPLTKGTEDEIERRKFREKIRVCVQSVIRALPAGELQGLSPMPRKHAHKVIFAIRNRMENIGGVEQVLQSPEDRRRWEKIVTVAGGGDVSMTSPTDYRSDTWDTKPEPL